MSVHYSSAIWNIPMANAGRKLVAVALADQASDEGGACFPSLRYLCRRCDMQERTVRGHISDLVTGGILTVTPRFKDGRQTSNEYTFADLSELDCMGGEGCKKREGGRGAKNNRGRGAKKGRGEGCKKQPPINHHIEPSLNHDEKEKEQLILIPPDSEPKSDQDQEASFKTFYALYPKKVAVGKARQSWMKQKPPLDQVLKTLERQCESPDWIKDGGKWIPMPSTWLNQQRWLDEETESGEQSWNPTGI